METIIIPLKNFILTETHDPSVNQRRYVQTVHLPQVPEHFGRIQNLHEPFGMILSQNEGIVEIVAEKKYGEVLGIHILGKGACEMAGQAALAIQMEITLEELANATFPHPTLSESLPDAARESLGQAIYLP